MHEKLFFGEVMSLIFFIDSQVKKTNISSNISVRIPHESTGYMIHLDNMIRYLFFKCFYQRDRQK